MGIMGACRHAAISSPYAGALPATFLRMAAINPRKPKARPVTAGSSEQLALDMSGITSAEVATFTGDVVVEAGAEKPRLVRDMTGKTAYKVERLRQPALRRGQEARAEYSGSGASFHLWLPVGP